MTVGDGHFSVLRSLFISNETRNPKVRGNNEFINNVVYNWKQGAYIMGDTSATSNANARGNYFIRGAPDARPGQDDIAAAPFSGGTSSFHTRTFTLNVRTNRIATGGEVRLKERERGTPHWDDKLTLEFNGTRPRVRSVRVAPAPTPTVTVYLAGDSTVTDQAEEPWAGCGQMLPRFFGPGVAVANHAESGESLRSFRGGRRLEEILSLIKPGDYLFVQFGHNDAKPGAGHSEPFTTYKDELARYANAARAKGATPVLVTSMHRRTFGPDGRVVNSHGDYPAAVRQAAAELGVALIDLHAMSGRLCKAMGPEASKKAFVHFPAGTFPGQEKPLKDDTHFTAYGAYELARCVAEAIRASRLPLARSLAGDVPAFDPARPDPAGRPALSPSPPLRRSATTPPPGN